MNSDRFVMVQFNPSNNDRKPQWYPEVLHGLYEIEDTSQSGDRRVLAAGLRFEAARMIVVALNHAT